MLAHLRPCVLLLVCVPITVTAQDAGRPVPNNSAKLAIAKYDAAVAKAKADYDGHLGAALKDLSAELDAAVKEATKAGQLETAVALRDLKIEIESEGPKGPPDKQLPAGKLGAVAADARKAFVGRWAIEYRGYKAVWTCLSDGTVVSSDGGGKGRWFLEMDRGQIAMTFGNHDLQVFPLPIRPQGMRYSPNQERGRMAGVAVKLP